jgi:hypothetical protein
MGGRVEAGLVTLLACSGPNVQQSIYWAIGFGQVLAWAGGVLTCLMVRDMLRARRFGWTIPPAVVFLAFHPAWWISPWNGDCGSAKIDLSIVSMAAFVGLYVAHLKWMAKQSA